MNIPVLSLDYHPYKTYRKNHSKPMKNTIDQPINGLTKKGKSSPETIDFPVTYIASFLTPTNLTYVQPFALKNISQLG